MNCKICGATIGDFDNNCSVCGTPVVKDDAPYQPAPEQPVNPQPVYPQDGYQQPTYPQNGFQQPYQPAAPAPADPGKGLGIASMVLGIVGFVSCCCLSATGIGAFIGPVCLIVGLILGFVAKSKSKSVGAKNSPALAGIILSIIPLALALIFVIVIAIFGSTIMGMLIPYLESMGMGDITSMLEEALGSYGMYY